jgi:uncharacterized protein (TIGR02594 family)
MADASDSRPRWLQLAYADLGTHETAGDGTTPRIIEYFRAVGHDWVTSDETAWCAAFLGACLERSGVPSTRSLAARSYSVWGNEIRQPLPGAIAVFSRGSDAKLGHVGFVIAATADHLTILGGNQGDGVSLARLPRRRLLNLRWPAIVPDPVPDNESAAFDVALQHVLLHEGGWTNDPKDPGGATFRGITLATYAADRGKTLTTETAARLRAELAALSDADTAGLYHRRYWLRAGCDRLPVPLAIMTFDAAVNQGPVTAIRLLQTALRVTVDGELGPVTVAAVGAASQARQLPALIHRFAGARRQRYRQTRNFDRFGRGWLSRVDATERLALSLIAKPAAPQPSTETKSMTQQPKWWGRSLTIWGALITAISTVLPIVGPLVGLDLSAADILRFGDQVNQVLQALGGILGTILTVYGRFRAEAPLERRTLQLSL